MDNVFSGNYPPFMGSNNPYIGYNPGTNFDSNAGYVAYVLFCLFGMCFFVQGLATFCAGLTSPRSSLSQLAYCMAVASVVMIQFYTVGYSLMSSSAAQSSTWSRFIGDLSSMFLKNVDFEDTYTVGHIVLLYGFFVVPGCLLASAACQRGRFVSMLVFIIAWMTFVYCPVAHWCWHKSGWSYQLGVLDYAGGTIIHITSGFGALVYSLVLGPRRNYGMKVGDQPFSLPMVIQGTTQMMLGWIGFTGGSQINDSGQALLSVFNTLLSASAGGFTWMCLDYILGKRLSHDENVPLSLVSFCSGVISGLVAITPGAGYVPCWAAMVFGLCGGVGCNLGTRVKFYLGVDDPLDVFAVHGIGGMIGTLLTGVFAMAKYRKPWLFLLQFMSGSTAAAYTLGCTLVVAIAIDSIPWLSMRIDPDLEAQGMDSAEHGESAIGNISAGSNLGVNSSSGNILDMSRLRQVNQNTPMQPGSFHQPMLQRLPLSYGTYTQRADNVDD